MTLDAQRLNQGASGRSREGAAPSGVEKDVLNRCRSRLRRLGSELLRYMEALRPPVVHEKAHVYPVSVPEKWQPADDSIIDWRGCPQGRPLRLYVHVPWCRSRCTFCFYESCAKEPSNEEVRDYFRCLDSELAICVAKLGGEPLKAEALYVGGGTPSILSPHDIAELLELIHRRVDFLPGASLIAEASPGTLSCPKVRAFADGGVTRISMGVQSFQEHVLRACRRDHDAAQAVAAYKALRSAGIPEINIDLMLGLPDQTPLDFMRSLQTTMELAPSSISFLDLRVAPGSLLHDHGRYRPAWRRQLLMRAIYQDLLAAGGRYRRTRPHYYLLPEEARGMTTRVPCLDSRTGPGFQVGLGVTAYSHLGASVFINARNPAYQRCLASGKLPVGRGLVLSEEDKAAMWAIRAIVDTTSVPDDPEILARYQKEMELLVSLRLLDAARRLTDDGCLFGEETTYLFYPSAALRPSRTDG
jgi:oxygen-independent coproporphyrinogen-3 oxidase